MGGIERASSHEVIHNQTRLTIKGFVFAQVLVVGLSLEVILQMEGNVVGLPIVAVIPCHCTGILQVASMSRL